MAVYYNEIDSFAAKWLRNLIAKNLIAPGDVDTRSIEDVSPADLIGYTQCHFFAGLGGWSYALRQAGWADDDEVWTGSCPCQPFSAAGKRGGTADERHLWPAFCWLIQCRRPKRILGEQVASKDGLAWLDIVQTDLEGSHYATGAVDICAAGVGAPHIRQRLYWMAYSAHEQQYGSGGAGQGRRSESSDRRPEGVALGDTHDEGSQGRRLSGTVGSRHRSGEFAFGSAGLARGVVNAASEQVGVSGRARQPRGPVGGFWRDAIWLPCIDGKTRPTSPEIFPLAHGILGRVGQLRAAGNAIVAPLAAEFARVARECMP